MLRVCPRCGSIYTAQTAFCGIDGERLVEQEHDPLIGQTVDRYTIGERLGTGAMGVVYRGAHTVLDREYAVKVLYGDFASDGRLVARFRREAQAASKIHHENIIEVIDFGTAESGLSFLAMELVEGKNLSDVIDQESPFSPARAANIAKCIASGLGEAHRLGFVHRDLKPANVMLATDEDGNEIAKVMDFGVVGAIGADDSTKLTRTGTIVGTPLYMAPEQAQGDPATPASDLYALGVILYEMIVGSPPFQGTSLRKVVMAHLTEPPPPLPQSSGLEMLVPSLLAKQPSRRPNRADQVVGEITRIQESMTGEVESAVFDAVIVDGLRQLGRSDSNPNAATKVQPGATDPSLVPTDAPPRREDSKASQTQPNATLPRGVSPSPRGASPVPRGASPLPRGASPLPRGASPLPRGGSFPGGEPLPPIPLAPLPPLERMPSHPGRPQVVESPFIGGSTPMQLDVADSYPELRIETKDRSRGKLLALLLLAAGIGVIGFVWSQRLREQEKRGKRSATAAVAKVEKPNAPSKSQASEETKADSKLAMLENQLLRMLAARRLSIPDLSRLEATRAAVGEWQRVREKDEKAASAAVSQLIQAVGTPDVSRQLFEQKLNAIGSSLKIAHGLDERSKADFRRRHAQLLADVQGADAARYRSLAPRILALEEDVMKATRKSP